MIFDTHAHYDSNAFNSDRDELLKRLHEEENVGWILDPGCDLESSRKAMEIAERHDFVCFAAGWHPEDRETLTEERFAEMLRLLDHPKCVAIGEIGLDYYWDSDHKEEQKELLHRQLREAVARDLPVIIHDREAHGDCLSIVKEYPSLRGVFHCYSGSAEMAKDLLNRGWYLGFDGPITYKNAKKALEVLEICPMDRILIETDSPYLTPVPFRGKRNDSGKLSFVCEKIAEIKECSAAEIEEITAENGTRLFGFPR